MDEQRRVVIEHADGRQYAVTLSDYRDTPINVEGHTYQQLGFRIVAWEGGGLYLPESRDPEGHALASEPPAAERDPGLLPEADAEARTVPRRAGTKE